MGKVLCTAQIWGTGPISKLSSILQLPEDQSAYRYINTSDVFHSYFLNEVPYTPITHVPDSLKAVFSGADALISVMNPEVAIAAKHFGLPVYYVDSLAWFWNVWDELDNGYYGKFMDLVDRSRVSLEQLLHILPYMNIYDLQWAAHVVSDVSLVQSCFPISPRRKEILGLNGKVVETGVIADRRLDPTHPVERSLVVVSANSCYNNPGYLDFISRIFALVSRQRTETDFLILTSVPGTAAKISENCRIDHVTRKTFLEFLNCSSRFFSPPGLTGLLENMFLGGTPFVLPSQHAGQEKNKEMLKLHFPSLPLLEWAEGKLSTKDIVGRTSEASRSPGSAQRYAEEILDSWDSVQERFANCEIADFIENVGGNGAAEVLSCVP